MSVVCKVKGEESNGVSDGMVLCRFQVCCKTSAPQAMSTFQMNIKMCVRVCVFVCKHSMFRISNRLHKQGAGFRECTECTKCLRCKTYCESKLQVFHSFSVPDKLDLTTMCQTCVNICVLEKIPFFEPITQPVN